MIYQALYRKYRPQTFAEIVGQDHVTSTLASEVSAGKVAHAYLFAGPRGTGKTTTARILAKSLNCADLREGGEPCNQCLSCGAITDATSLDVIELDAASHNKVEDVREMRVNAGTVASVGGAKRVYILDEAHMLSRAASNALLKILEEPPDHVHFVLATTEPYKLLDTIRSRAQRFDFHPVPTDLLKTHIEQVGGREEFAMEPEAVTLIAHHATGSVRDALSLLEQVAALGGGAVEPAMVTKALGLADREVFGRLVGAIAEGDAPAALTLVGTLSSQGADLRRFVAEALEFFRGVFLAQYAPNLEEIVDENKEIVDEWRHHARELSSTDVLRAIDQLSEALVQLREGKEERLVVELALLRLARPETAVDPASLAARLERMEERVRRAAKSEPAPVQAETAPRSRTADEVPPVEEARAIPRPTAESEQADEAAMAPAEDLELDTVEASWPALVARLREESGPRRHALFREAAPVEVDGSRIVLGVPNHLPFHLEQLRQDDLLKTTAESIGAELFGGAIVIEYRESEAAASEEPALEQVESKAPDADQLLEEGEGGVDPTELVVEHLGGQVVSEE